MSSKKSPRYQMPDGGQVEFEYEAVPANGFIERERAAGREVNAFDQVLVARIYAPGVSRRQVPVIEIERHFHQETAIAAPRVRRNQVQYQRFKIWLDAWRQGADGAPMGTPVEESGLFGAAAVAQFKAAGAHTMEALAATPDSALSQLGMGGPDARERARMYLAAKSGGQAIEAVNRRIAASEQKTAAEMDKLRAENERMAGELAALKQGQAAAGAGRTK